MTRMRERASQIMSIEDPLYKAIADAQDAIQSLCVKVHYLSCKSGVGEKPRE